MFSFTANMLVLVSTLVLYKSIRLWRNVQIAKSTSLPYTISLFHEFENFTFITTPVLRYFCTDYLMKGKGWPKWARFMIQRWQYEDKYRAHKEFGDTFLVVSPCGLICYTADAIMAMDVCTRRNYFTKPRDRYKMVEIYGPNVLSSEGELYRFHVKVTAPPFRESNNQLVWMATVRQTIFFARAWSGSASVNFKDDLYSLALNVIAAAGFGKQLDLNGPKAQIPPGHKMSFQESLSDVVDHFGHIALLPRWLLRNSPWKRIAHAVTEFDDYMRELIMTEKEKLSRSVGDDGRTKGNLLTAMLKASAGETVELDSKNKWEKKTHFSDDEVLGNAFMFLFAGHETTATTMVYGGLMLALHVDLQDRMIEEVDRNFREAAKQGRQELDYDIDYPKFQYTLAFMHEILRMFPPVKNLNKIVLQEQYITHQGSQTSPINGQPQISHLLPANCRVSLNFVGVHYNPRSWKNPHTFDPNRWLSKAPNLWDPALGIDDNPQLVSDAHHIPAHVKGSFLAFSEGARACLGRKFALVEFVAFFVTLLHEHRLELGPGEVPEHVERVLQLKSAATFMLSAPGNTKLILRPRKSAG